MDNFSYLLIGLICAAIIGGILSDVYYFQPAAQAQYNELKSELNDLKTCSQLQLFDKNINYLTGNDYARTALHEKVIEKSKEVCK